MSSLASVSHLGMAMEFRYVVNDQMHIEMPVMLCLLLTKVENETFYQIGRDVRLLM